MKLSALRLHGFKSFADRTEIEFHDGITAIVGPNGCGKSNISDAIRWVLGEQRPTAIRGAKMEEAIFQGTTSRRPVHRGSVEMQISNGANLLPIPYEEVEITRTVYRDGGSEYQLNRSACRLRDIHDLCRDTGLGANAYAVIENRMIDTILSDRAEERRGLFEEAAGIGRYKDRRKGASRRLERAEADLQRLEDVIGEVQSKVRSLARQKGKAARHEELRNRRLALEVTIVRAELDELRHRSEEVERLLQGGTEKGQGLHSELVVAETRVETLRTERLEAERERGAAAARVEELRAELSRWERELAVADERSSQGNRRLERMGAEREELALRAERATGESAALEVQAAERSETLEDLRARLADGRARAESVEVRLEEARQESQAAEAREREVAHRAAQLRGDIQAAESQGRELEVRHTHLVTELEEASQTLSELRSQGDLFGDRMQELERGVEEAGTALERALEGVPRAEEALEEARSAEVTAQDRAGSLGARLEALERMERAQEGMDPVLRALLANPPAGVVGVLADHISAEPAVLGLVESYLGVLGRGLVVRDLKAAEAVTRWFREEWSGGGGIVMLPLDSVPSVENPGTLLEKVEARGEGAPWVKALLDGVDLGEDASALTGGIRGPGGRDVIGPDGLTLTRGGLVRVGNPLGATGVLERKEELRGLRGEVEAARKLAVEASSQRAAVHEALRGAESLVRDLRGSLREAEDRLRDAQVRDAERTSRGTRMEREVEDLERQIEAAVAGRERAAQRVEEARSELESMTEEEAALQRARTASQEALSRVTAEWEAAQREVSALSVEEARLEAELDRIRERRAEMARLLRSGEERSVSLDREETELVGQLERGRELRREGEEATRELFRERDEARLALKSHDSTLEEIDSRLAEAERAVRRIRSEERDASEVRHRLELEARELEGRIGRIQERLEGEWGRPLAELLSEADPVEGEVEELREELQEAARKLEGLGPVNMLAVEEHEEESRRLEFLEDQRDDLLRARDDLRSAIREINRTATRLFSETFEGVRANFRDTFLRLFEGGECDVWLEDPDDPLESNIEIHASPRGKRTQRIDLLSGGERALTALSLLFGIYLVKPSPFCVLDEVDAPLDESNIGRFIRLLQEFKEQTQFIVITHNPRTIEAADWIYGVTMEEPGVSSIVGVRLEEALEQVGV
ncbi:MAG: chromosome segregation protein SMC [Gemmatimonadota bacterium]